jgi:hypothetical protein
MTQHAVFSPSSSHRWFACPGSIRLSQGIPSRPSRYADEGSAAHALAAKCFATQTDPQDHIGDSIGDPVAFPIDEPMAATVAVFVDFVRVLSQSGYQLQFEQRLDLSHLAPDQFGTGDAILHNPDTRHLVVTDFKNGIGVPVYPEDNPQLLAYASGAYQQVKSTPIEALTLVIVQPRAPALTPIRHWNTTPQRLQDYEGEFRTAVARANNPTAPLIPGDHCRFCPAASICPAFRGRVMADARAEFAAISMHTQSPGGNGSRDMNAVQGDNNAGQGDNNAGPITLPPPDTLTPTDLGQILQNAHLLEHWLDAVKAHALQQALNGNPPDGFKVVRKITHRKWTDEDAVAQKLKRVLPPDSIWAPQKMRSPAQLEKALGKTRSAILAPFIVHPDGDPTLAPVTDKRPALTTSPAEEFKQLSSPSSSTLE